MNGADGLPPDHALHERPAPPLCSPAEGRPAGFFLARCAAAYSRRTQWDWYDIAFVLLHNDVGGPEAAAQAVLDRFSGQLSPVRTALADPAANFANTDAQGSRAYARQMAIDHPEVERATALADAVVVDVDAFCAHVRVGFAERGDPSATDPTGAVSGPSAVLDAPARRAWTVTPAKPPASSGRTAACVAACVHGGSGRSRARHTRRRSRSWRRTGSSTNPPLRLSSLSSGRPSTPSHRSGASGPGAAGSTSRGSRT